LQLSDYIWSGNPRGMHNVGAYYPIDRNRITSLQLGWYKFVTGGEEFAGDCQWLLANNVTPVIRIYRAVPGAMPVDDSLRRQWADYRSAGALWFEFYNEPNLPDPEWPGDMRSRISITNIEEVVRPLCENWLTFAEYIINLGAYPGFPSFSETVGPEGALQWQDALLIYLRDHHRDRFVNIINNGLWAAVHPYTLNHFYQEAPGQSATPRQPNEQNGIEGGWHFEYPYDPYTQSYDPGRTVFGGTALTPYGDPNGLTAMGIAFNQRMREWFDAGPLPAVGTEGGIYPLPDVEAKQPDPRFPYYDGRSHGEATVAMFNWMATNGPEWLFGLCLWKEDDYYNYNLPAVQRMMQVPQTPRGGLPPSANPFGLGPGPVHGEPTFHMVVLAPGLDPGWFFDTAQSYWNTFRPIVTNKWDFIDYIPNDRSLAITLIAPPDMLSTMQMSIQGKYPNIILDTIIIEGDQSTVADVFNNRVWANRRLG
jgi:hypothetical protein